MKKVILAGGGGTRLWPISIEDMPKQFISIFSDSSLLQDTVKRLSNIDGGLEDIYFSTHQKYKDKIIKQIGCPQNKLILEPERKNTAPAIALLIKYLEDIVSCDQNEVVLICPSDHIVSPEKSFANYILSGVDSAKEGNMVIFGIKPTKPETGYGYIKCHNNGGIVPVEGFMEKPDLETATQYLSSGNYLWNAGIFMFTIKTIKEAFQKYCPQLFHLMQEPYHTFVEKFGTLESISFDYAVMEKATNVVVCPMDLFWSDIGSWDAVDEIINQNQIKNYNPYLKVDQNNNMIYSKEKVIVDGIQNSFVIVGDAGTYIAQKGNSQAIKDLLI